MLVAKCITGVWLVRFNVAPVLRAAFSLFAVGRPAPAQVVSPQVVSEKRTTLPSLNTRSHDIAAISAIQRSDVQPDKLPMPPISTSADPAPGLPIDPVPSARPTSGTGTTASRTSNISLVNRQAPLSIYPSLLLGSAMAARGEIGLLIASLAESSCVFSITCSPEGNQAPSDIYIITLWGILLCTIIGPLSVGGIVRRVRALQKKGSLRQNGLEDPLGVWGVSEE